MKPKALTFEEQRDVIAGFVFALTGALPSNQRRVLYKNLLTIAAAQPSDSPRTRELLQVLAGSVAAAAPAEFAH